MDTTQRHHYRETLVSPDLELEEARYQYTNGIKSMLHGAILAIADLAGLVVYVSLSLGVWHQVLAALAAWLQVLLWVAALGLIGAVGYRAIVQMAEGYIAYTHGHEIIEDWRAQRHQHNKLIDAEVTRVTSEAQVRTAEADRIRAEAENLRRSAGIPTTIKYDQNGNPDIVFDPVHWQFHQFAPGQFNPNVPHTYHYSETLAPGIKSITEGDQPALPSAIRDLPKIEQFYGLIESNSLQTAMGIEAATGKPIIVPIRKSTHFKLIGGSGMGKSCLSASMIDIAARTNDPDHLKIGLLDLEHNTSRLFENLPHIAEIGPRRQRLIGRDPDEVAQKLKLLQWELTRRANLGEEHCKLHEPVLLVYVEEMLALKYEVVDEKLKKEMLAAINILGVRARKYGIFLLACMQTDYSDKSTREAMAQFRTRAGFAIDPEVARASGFFNTDLVKQNFQAGCSGQYVLEKPQYSGLVLAPDYDVAARLEQLNAPSHPTTKRGPTPFIDVKSTAHEAAPEASEGDTEAALEGAPASPLQRASRADLSVFTPQEQRIINKFLTEGLGISQIVASEFTTSKGEALTGGEAFKQRSKEVQDILRRAFNQEAS